MAQQVQSMQQKPASRVPSQKNDISAPSTVNGPNHSSHEQMPNQASRVRVNLSQHEDEQHQYLSQGMDEESVNQIPRPTLNATGEKF